MKLITNYNMQEENIENQNENQINPFQIIFQRLERLENYVTQINTYTVELSKVNNNGWESYEDWSTRIGKEMSSGLKDPKNIDFSVLRNSGIIL